MASSKYYKALCDTCDSLNDIPAHFQVNSNQLNILNIFNYLCDLRSIAFKWRGKLSLSYLKNWKMFLMASRSVEFHQI